MCLFIRSMVKYSLTFHIFSFSLCDEFCELEFSKFCCRRFVSFGCLICYYCFYGLANAVHKTNPSLPREILVTYDRTSAVDILIKVVGFLLAVFIYPPFGLCSVILSAIRVVLKMQLHIVDDNY